MIKFFVTNCPQCNGTKIGNIDIQKTKQQHWQNTFPVLKEGELEQKPCETCDSQGKVIVEIKSPFIADQLHT